jgi:anti-sigma regulatory factor (Ser/Thr protein kinase)
VAAHVPVPVIGEVARARTAVPSWPPAWPARWSVLLPKDVAAVRTARAAADEWLGGEPARLRSDARSVVTELVGNAIRHGEPPILLKIERTSRGLRIDVSDAGAQRPTYSRTAHTTRWGLRIVDALADRWGIAENASRVWCVLERERAGASPAATPGIPAG